MKPEQIHNAKILISSLNWGYGHVSRSIAIIEQLIHNQNEVIVACDNDQEAIFKQYFPEIQFVRHKGYPFNFSGNGNFTMDLIKSFSLLKKRLKNEYKEVEAIIKEYKPNAVISDHRYGFWSPDVYSVFITHQLQLPVKWYQKVVQFWHRRLVSQFNAIWVLDYEDRRLTGKLSHSKGFDNVHYIGPYSRFMNKMKESEINDGSTLLIASGPQVYAQQLINENLKKNMKVICSGNVVTPEEAVVIRNDWKSQDAAIQKASTIISRCGYSTIMDSLFLDADMYLIPTPGQYEQIYLNELRKKQSVDN